MTRILFVCLGNICRSPTAEAVMARLVDQAGCSEQIAVESAGTGGWHVGSPADRRAAAAALERGLTLGGVARQVTSADFERFDLLIAMDRDNAAELRRRAPSSAAQNKVRLLRDFDPDAAGSAPGGGAADLDVPDPYYGGVGGFDHVLDLIERACAGLLQTLRRPA